MNAKVYLSAEKHGTVLKGHPWIFPKAIASHQGTLKNGELVHVYSHDKEHLAVGVYNEHSLYRIRVLALANEPVDKNSISALIAFRLEQAALVRKTLDLPNAQTTAYRLFNSEADGLSGLTIDRFNQLCVIASSAYWVEKNKNTIMEVVNSLFPDDEILWLAQTKPLTQDGWTDFSNPEIAKTMQVLEAGVQYQVEFGNSQKTGLFLDQRDNHQRLANLYTGKKVLDLYTYCGGFALHAAKAGATHVTAVDSSAQAIMQARANAELNGLQNIQFIEDDAREYLTQAIDYDVIILDPPKLVPSQKHLQRAKNYYRFLHRELFKHMKSGSLLMTCNCSSALSSQEFSNLVSTQANMVGKQARILGVYGPSLCHPTLVAFPEGNYLTAVLLVLL